MQKFQQEETGSNVFETDFFVSFSRHFCRKAVSGSGLKNGPQTVGNCERENRKDGEEMDLSSTPMIPVEEKQKEESGDNERLTGNEQFVSLMLPV